MVSASDKKKMSKFICDRLDERGKYSIIESDDEHVFLNVDEKDVKIYIFLHSFKRAIRDYKKLASVLREHGNYTSDIFYKDGELFHVRLGWRANAKLDLSLKRYLKDDRDKMLHLRGLEKEALPYTENTLAYYQPNTERLTESIRVYKLSDVNLDYSHVDSEHEAHGFVSDGKSIDYKIANEIFSIPSLQIGFRAVNTWSKKLVIVGK